MRNPVLIAFYLVASLCGLGCQLVPSPLPTNSQPDVAAQLQQARRKNQNQLRKIEKLNQQLDTLTGLSSRQRQQRIRVESIETGRYTGGFDDNNDGADDGLNIYLLLRDQYGDVIKAAGQVRVELWDLAQPKTQRLWAQWPFNAADLQSRWLTGLLSHHYKFSLHWQSDAKPQHKNLTLKLTFTETLTGRTFELQKMLTVSLASNP